MNKHKLLPSEPTNEMLGTFGDTYLVLSGHDICKSYRIDLFREAYRAMYKAAPAVEQEPTIPLKLHSALVAKLASEVYAVVGSLHAANEKVSDSTYESILTRLVDVINNPSILQSDEKLLVPFEQ
jgi:hypothetical protein